jgi:5'-nucleotidase
LREQDYFWLTIQRNDRAHSEDSETFVVLNGGISVTPLQFERTAVEALVELKNTL